MPYFTQVRMRVNCDRGISHVAGGSGAWTTSRRTGTAGEIIPSTRGLRADWSAGAEAGTDGPLTGGFDPNSASAAWRALVICSRSSPRGCICCCRLNKISSQPVYPSLISKSGFVSFGKLAVGAGSLSASSSLSLKGPMAPQKSYKIALWKIQALGFSGLRVAGFRPGACRHSEWGTDVIPSTRQLGRSG